jgi:hypothetical protein
MIPSRIYPPVSDPALAESLRVATSAAEALEKMGIEASAARLRKGHIPELVVSSLPSGVDFALQSRFPDPEHPDEVLLVHVAVWAGARLVWRHRRRKLAEVRHA